MALLQNYLRGVLIYIVDSCTFTYVLFVKNTLSLCQKFPLNSYLSGISISFINYDPLHIIELPNHKLA